MQFRIQTASKINKCVVYKPLQEITFNEPLNRLFVYVNWVICARRTCDWRTLWKSCVLYGTEIAA